MALITALFVTRLLFTGCREKDSWDAAENSLLTFSYGCSIEEAEDYFGPHETDRESVEQNESITTYRYNIQNWDIGAESLSISTSSPKIKHTPYPLGVHAIEFVFRGQENEEKMIDLFTMQKNACEKPNPSRYENTCSFGSREKYEDSAFVRYFESENPSHLDPPEVWPKPGSSFHAESWNKRMPPVRCACYHLSDLTADQQDIGKAEIAHDTRYLVFNGKPMAYAVQDDYFQALVEWK